MHPDREAGTRRSGRWWQNLRGELTAIVNRHPQRAYLMAYRDGELNPRQNRRMATHLEHCSECRLQSELDRWRIDRLLGEDAESPAGAARREEFQHLLRSIRSSQFRLTRALLTLLVGRKAATQEGVWPAGARILKPLTAILIVATVIHVVLGLIVWSGWQVTGNLQWARAFFTRAGDLYLVEMAAAALYLASQVLRGFSTGEPLREGWFLVCTACVCDVTGLLFSKLLAAHENPLWRSVQPIALFQFGQFLSGPLRLGIMACALFSVLRAYHRAGILTVRLRISEWTVLAFLGFYTVCENVQAVLIRSVDGQWSPQFFIASATDPLLLVVLAAALLLRRSVHNLGGRYLERCWAAMAAAFGLTFLGNITTWALNSGYFSLRVTSIGWNLWFLAGAALPLAYAFQLHAMVRTAEFADNHVANGAPTTDTSSQG
jgi:hypothetical protein